MHEIESVRGEPLSLNVMGVQHGNDGETINMVHVQIYQHTISHPVQMTILHHGQVATPQDLQQNIQRLKREGPTSLRQMDDLQKQIGNCTAKAIKQFAKQQHFSLDDDIDLIGTSGCLVDEQSKNAPELDGSAQVQESTELGDLSIVAANTYKTTVGEFHGSAVAMGLPQDSLLSSFESLLEGQADDSGVADSARGPLNAAFFGFEGYVGRPLSASDDDDNERAGHVGHVQFGDNFFELRKKVVKFWGECPSDGVTPTQQLIVECEC